MSDLEILSKKQLMDKIKEYEKSLRAQAIRHEKTRRNLQSQREQVNNLNKEIQRLKLENNHLQNVLIRKTKAEEQQDLVEMLINDFKDERKNSMDLEHSLMVTEWELTDKTEDLKELSEQMKEKDKRYKAEMEQIKIQIQDLEAREQRNREWITRRESHMIDAKESVLELEEHLQEKDKIIDDLKDKLNKANSYEQVPVITNTSNEVQGATVRPYSWSSVRWGAQFMVKNIIFLQNNLY